MNEIMNTLNEMEFNRTDPTLYSIFKDLWVFDPDECKWTEVQCKENPTYPEYRTCHSMFIYNKNISNSTSFHQAITIIANIIQ